MSMWDEWCAANVRNIPWLLAAFLITAVTYPPNGCM